ncbi:MAG: carbamoyl-phosphate synthase large subunit [Planctomycetes bacterium]|nr:carbamoyl-phosphate synthase large subunit [Planctomycetota bacterium]
MPKRNDIKSILIIGSGPIVIGQACEFDYSGTQACKALKKEGYRIILVNSNPATIMTDPEFADKTYIEPLTVESLEKIISKERPDALLPTLGGQTALNLTFLLHEKGIIDNYGVEILGASAESIKLAEDRELFKNAMNELGLKTPKSIVISSYEEALEALKEINTPCIIRSSFTLGGTGCSICYNQDEFAPFVKRALSESLIRKVIIEESLIGWKEFELEVMRDSKDNCVIVCPIENFDPMGVHTGDSITVAPIMTLSDREYQNLRNLSFQIIRKIGVACGGSNIQFAQHPDDGRIYVIEMNPRVSRSSALASKATGFPIAKIASLLAVGYTLDEIPNDITKITPSSFEPVIDYVVVKIPKWAFEKFPGVNTELTIQMKSIGEVMAIGRTFQEALQKAVRSLEDKSTLNLTNPGSLPKDSSDNIRKKLSQPNRDRLSYIKLSFTNGLTTDEIHELSKIDKWFLNQIKELVEFERSLKKSMGDDQIIKAKQFGFSDAHLAIIKGISEEKFRKRRSRLIKPGYNLVDTCAGEFEAYTPYYYSSYNSTEVETKPDPVKKVMILGSGPNRIGQAIEFDYSCVHAAMALREIGYKVIMVNSNPETVSTDYDTSDYLFFEPVTFEDIVNIYEVMKPEGVIVQFGGQTPINLSERLKKAGCKILGTDVKGIQIAEDRKKSNAFMARLRVEQPEGNAANNREDALAIAKKIGFPVIVRPSFVLGGRAMEICFTEKEVEKYVHEACEAAPDQPILIDSYLEDAIEIDVDAISDGQSVLIGGILEHIQYAGVHSGDSSMCLPTFSLSHDILKKIETITTKIGLEMKIIGLFNLQLAVKNSKVYMLEVNPRASRTVPFVSKARGIQLAKIATKVIMGGKLKQLAKSIQKPKLFFVKESVLPFNKLAPIDIILGPEMKSTGEVMGIGTSFGQAYAKSQLGAGFILPKNGLAFVSFKNSDKKSAPDIVSRLQKLNFKVLSTKGTAQYLKEKGVIVDTVNKVSEGRPNMIDYLLDDKISLVINTPTGKGGLTDEGKIRALAVRKSVPAITTIQTAFAMLDAIESYQNSEFDVKSLQEIFQETISEKNSVISSV